MLTKFIDLVKRFQYDIYLGICFALVAVIAFNLGRTGIFESSKVTYTQNADFYRSIGTSTIIEPTTTIGKLDKRVVVSKSSTSMKYHFTWCSGANIIKEENKVWFTTEAEAISAGYSLAGNCK